MPEQTAIPFYYTVRLAPRDPAEMLHGALYDLRRAYYESGKRGRVSSHSAYNGFPCHTQGFLSRHNFKWQRRVGHQLREEAFRFEKGHALLIRNEQGALMGRIVYGPDQQWLRSAYVIPGQAEPQVILQPGPEPGTLLMLTRTGSGSFQKKTLYPAPFAPGTLVQSRINAQYGEPDVTASTSQGDFCYTSREESEKRAQLLRQITSGTVPAMPKWQGESPAPASFHASMPTNEKAYQDTSFLFDDEPAAPSQKEPVSEEKTIDEEKAAGTLPPASAESEGKEETPSDPAPEPGDSVPEPRMAEGTNETPATPEEIVTPQESASPAVTTPPSRCRVTVSARDSYLYFGEMLEGLRHGRGRTQQSNGYTAYEGTYKNGQRDGWGAYYYRSGEPCYVGSFRENKRDGIGVTFQEKEHWIHVGSWQKDAPEGVSSLFDKKGNLLYAGMIENGKKQGAGAVLKGPDGRMFVGKWKDNEPTGEGSAFDREGNLLYTGSWKNGLREGEGTSFDKKGRVVFTGLWHNDRYDTGLHLRRLEDGRESNDEMDEND
ncbi:MAG TPA: hypothetical protein H9691_02405 [Firmicutes bacterium]|nr:hypothetical protein [Bacillota bacterium]